MEEVRPSHLEKNQCREISLLNATFCIYDQSAFQHDVFN